MDDKKGNIILGIILAILMVIAIVIVIINPNKVETVNYDAEKNTQQENNIVTPTVKQTTSTEKLQKDEKQNSMQVGGKFCKIGNTAVFYEEKDKSVYMYNLENNTTSKIATLATGAEKIYFDGENIYAIPSYQSGKGIYKIDLTGNTQKIYNDSSLGLVIITAPAPIFTEFPIFICCSTIDPTPKKFKSPILTSPEIRVPGINEL